MKNAWENWFIGYSQRADSGMEQRAKFTAVLSVLGGESGTVKVERRRHAAGWVERILVDPSDRGKVGSLQEVIYRMSRHAEFSLVAA